MDLSELSALRAGLKLYAGSKAEVARRADVSPTYVQTILAGKYKNYHLNPTCMHVIHTAKALLDELTGKSQTYLQQIEKKTA
jgi:transcriptional regulator with XRE-family HTH domain